MSVRRTLHFYQLWLVIGALLASAILILCLIPPSNKISSIEGLDKVEHALAFLALTAWFAALIERPGYWALSIMLLGLGVGIEIAQYLMALGRSAEIFDVIADTVGIILGVIFSLSIHESWLQRIERWLHLN
ncbi:MAG: hypothetical protein EXR88_04820 [Gammaproteobacteria bacterium]|nr:hypothetical protein [Gammaproteobacteria bacterium]